MTRKIYVNGDLLEVTKDRIKASELIELTGRAGGDYKLELRDGDGGPLLEEFEGEQLIDLARCGRAGGPGQTTTNTGAGGDDSLAGRPGQTTTNTGAGGDDSLAGRPGQTTTNTGAGEVTETRKNGDGPGSKPSVAANNTPCYFTTSYTKPINPA